MSKHAMELEQITSQQMLHMFSVSLAATERLTAAVAMLTLYIRSNRNSSNLCQMFLKIPT